VPVFLDQVVEQDGLLVVVEVFTIHHQELLDQHLTEKVAVLVGHIPVVVMDQLVLNLDMEEKTLEVVVDPIMVHLQLQDLVVLVLSSLHILNK